MWAHWKRLNAPPDATLADSVAIDTWFTNTIAAYSAIRASGHTIDEFVACLIMLDNLPDM